jgi:CheY-like chemotaxis protein
MNQLTSNKVIFIADDDSDDRFFIKHAFASSKIHAEVIEAENGIELAAMLESTPLKASLIIVDMNMPKMNGLETALRINKIPSATGIPIVIVSTSPSQQLNDDARQAGVAAVYRKPDSLEEFGLLIEIIQTKFLL